jgi:hypothetical protein
MQKKSLESNGIELDPKLSYEHNILEPTIRVTFFNNGFKSDLTKLFPSIVLVIANEKRFPLATFNLKIVRIQCGSGSWMLLDVVLHYSEGSASPHMKNVMNETIISFGLLTSRSVRTYSYLHYYRNFR